MKTQSNIVIPCGQTTRKKMKRTAERLNMSVAGLGRLLFAYGLEKLEAGTLSFEPAKIQETETASDQ